MTDTADKRLRLARQHAGFPDGRAAARAHGWKDSTYRAHEMGLRNFRPEQAELYGKAFSVSPGWLLTGEHPPAWLPRQGHRFDPLKRSPVRSLPLLSYASLGSMRAGEDPMSVAASGSVAVDHGDDIGPRAFAIRLPDDSMSPGGASANLSLGKDDVVVIDPDAAVKPGDIVLALPRSRELPILRKLRHRQSPSGDEIILELAPHNSNYPVLTVAKESGGAILGRAVRHIRPL